MANTRSPAQNTRTPGHRHRVVLYVDEGHEKKRQLDSSSAVLVKDAAKRSGVTVRQFLVNLLNAFDKKLAVYVLTSGGAKCQSDDSAKDTETSTQPLKLSIDQVLDLISRGEAELAGYPGLEAAASNERRADRYLSTVDEVRTTKPGEPRGIPPDGLVGHRLDSDFDGIDESLGEHEVGRKTRCIYQPFGVGWKIGYRGRPIVITQSLDGFLYLRQLLDEPGRAYTGVELRALIEGVEESNPGYDETTDAELSAEALFRVRTAGLGRRDEDERRELTRLKTITKNLQDLQEQIEDAVERGEVDKQAKLEEQQVMLFRRCHELGLGREGIGDSKSDDIRAAENISKLIHKALDAIEEQDPDLAWLRQRLHLGARLSYAPYDHDPLWEVDSSPTSV